MVPFDASDAFLHPVGVRFALQHLGHVAATLQPGGHILPALLEFAHVLALCFGRLVLGHALQDDVLQVTKADLLVGHGRCDLVEVAQWAGSQRMITCQQCHLLGVLAAHALVQDDAAVIVELQDGRDIDVAQPEPVGELRARHEQVFLVVEEGFIKPG